jgi:hypothetical protein
VAVWSYVVSHKGEFVNRSYDPELYQQTAAQQLHLNPAEVSLWTGTAPHPHLQS